MFRMHLQKLKKYINYLKKVFDSTLNFRIKIRIKTQNNKL